LNIGICFQVLIQLKTGSSLLQHLKSQINHPEKTESYLITDNGSCFHSTGFILYLINIFKQSQLKLLKYAYFDPGEGKSIADQRFRRVDE